METLDKHSPKKIKKFRRNHKPHINKTPRKATTKRSQLKKKQTKLKTPMAKYKKHRNVVKLKNQSKKGHFDSLIPFLGSKLFSKGCKPYFSNKYPFGD